MGKRTMHTPSKKHGWPIHVIFTGNDDSTRADVVIDVGGNHYHAWGRARRSPADPVIPRIGEEVAAARALSDLARQLVASAADELEDLDGNAVSIHL